MNTKDLNIFVNNTDWKALDEQIANLEMDMVCEEMNK